MTYFCLWVTRGKINNYKFLHHTLCWVPWISRRSGVPNVNRAQPWWSYNKQGQKSYVLSVINNSEGFQQKCTARRPGKLGILPVINHAHLHAPQFAAHRTSQLPRMLGDVPCHLVASLTAWSQLLVRLSLPKIIQDCTGSFCVNTITTTLYSVLVVDCN